MTRDEALNELHNLYCKIPNAVMTTEMYGMYKAVQAYVDDSIPTPKVDVVNGMNERELYVTINGELCHDQPFYLMRKAESQRDALVAALGIEVKP